MKYLLLGSAVFLSSIAAYFSIAGLITIFPGAIISIIVMAFGLELAKIVVAVWSHTNWDLISRLTKLYLSFAVIVLMAITSTGIFGFLSKSHIEHNSNISFLEQSLSETERKIQLENEIISRIKSLIDEKKVSMSQDKNSNKDSRSSIEAQIQSIYEREDSRIQQINSEIKSNKERLTVLDDQLNQLRNQKTGFFSSNKSKIEKLEQSQSKEREYISSQIESLNNSIAETRNASKKESDLLREKISQLSSQKYEIDPQDLKFIEEQQVLINNALQSIENLNLKKFEAESKVLKFENELGPIKYISELVNDLTGSDLDTEFAVRIVIVLLVSVFDPLAIVMIVCAYKDIHRNQNPESAIGSFVEESEAVKEEPNPTKYPEEKSKKILDYKFDPAKKIWQKISRRKYP